jgi:hypothetical protein
MAIFGSTRDITMFKGITKEFVEDVVSQQIGYYKVVLSTTQTNVYGEALNKQYIGPVLIYSLIERGDFAFGALDTTTSVNRPVTFRFFKDHMIDANVVPEVGDIVMYNELYYEVDNVNENQLIVGKDNQYAYSTGLENFGSSYSIILTTHYTSGDKLGITQQRI